MVESFHEEGDLWGACLCRNIFKIVVMVSSYNVAYCLLLMFIKSLAPIRAIEKDDQSLKVSLVLSHLVIL